MYLNTSEFWRVKVLNCKLITGNWSHLKSSKKLVEEVDDDAIGQSPPLHDVAEVLGDKRHHHVTERENHKVVKASAGRGDCGQGALTNALRPPPAPACTRTGLSTSRGNSQRNVQFRLTRFGISPAWRRAWRHRGGRSPRREWRGVKRWRGERVTFLLAFLKSKKRKVFHWKQPSQLYF